MGEITNKTKGRVKQAVGALTKNKMLQQEGKRDELKGKVEGVIKKVKTVLK